MHSILSAVSLNAILRSPLKVPYSYHPLGVTAFVAFTSAAVATSQRLRGAVSSAVRKSTVLLHGTFSFLALLSLAAAQVAIVRFFSFFFPRTRFSHTRAPSCQQYLSKESLSRPHLTSSHGKLGALGGLFFVLTMMAGSALVLAPKLFPKIVKVRAVFGCLCVSPQIMYIDSFSHIDSLPRSRTVCSDMSCTGWWWRTTRWRCRTAT